MDKSTRADAVGVAKRLLRVRLYDLANINCPTERYLENIYLKMMELWEEYRDTEHADFLLNFVNDGFVFGQITLWAGKSKAHFRAAKMIATRLLEYHPHIPFPYCLSLFSSEVLSGERSDLKKDAGASGIGYRNFIIGKTIRDVCNVFESSGMKPFRSLKLQKEHRNSGCDIVIDALGQVSGEWLDYNTAQGALRNFKSGRYQSLQSAEDTLDMFKGIIKHLVRKTKKESL